MFIKGGICLGAATARPLRLPSLVKILALNLFRLIQKSARISQDMQKHRESHDEIWRAPQWILEFTVESN